LEQLTVQEKLCTHSTKTCSKKDCSAKTKNWVWIPSVSWYHYL